MDHPFGFRPSHPCSAREGLGKMATVVFAGGGEAIQALLSNTVQLSSGVLAPAHPLIKSGTVKGLAVTGAALAKDEARITILGVPDRPGLVHSLFLTIARANLVVDMIVAIATNRLHSIQATGVLGWLDDFLYLPEVLYVMILVRLIFSGPGRYSLDGLIGR